MSNQNQNVLLSAEQLQEIVKTAVAAAVTAVTAPTTDEAEAIEAQRVSREQDKQMRQERAELELQRIANRKLEQELCSHLRPDGTSRTVHIFGSNNLNDYMYCQECGGFIHAEPRPTANPLAKEFENHIFDTRLFNTHYRMSQAKTTF